MIFPIAGFSAFKGFDPKNVFRGDSLVLRIVGSTPIDSIDFPTIPAGFEPLPPHKKTKKRFSVAKDINKDSDYFFHFSTPASCYRGGWNYDSRYSQPESRWLFNEIGVYTSFVFAEYVNWKKNDHINVFLNERRTITDSAFQVLDHKGEKVSFELITKRNPTYTILLNLERDLGAFQKLTLLVSNSILKEGEKHKRYYRYPMNVGDKGTVGLGGKFNSLEK
ncbi:MAG: hypothetical protein R2804_09040 [Cyclobacteriaceae bacterium]